MARTRRHACRLPGGAPPVLDDEDSDEPVCVDLDATLVTAHSEEDGAAGIFAVLKNELVHRTVYPTREHARKDIGRYIELRYNV